MVPVPSQREEGAQLVYSPDRNRPSAKNRSRNVCGLIALRENWNPRKFTFHSCNTKVSFLKHIPGVRHCTSLIPIIQTMMFSLSLCLSLSHYVSLSVCLYLSFLSLSLSLSLDCIYTLLCSFSLCVDNVFVCKTKGL